MMIINPGSERATPMLKTRFLDEMLDLMRFGEVPAALHAIYGYLHALRDNSETWPQSIEALRQHRLHGVLLEDSFLSHCFTRPRGYPGDAGLIDIIYDRKLPAAANDRAAQMFAQTTGTAPCEAVRLRREYARTLVADAHRAGQRICVLACGHFREGDDLIGQDLSGITLVDQDPLSLEVVRRNHAVQGARIEEANVFAFLRRAAQAGEQYDLVYTLGLTDYLDDRAMVLLHRLLHRVTAPGGRAVVANFRPDLMCTAWMEAVMDWTLIYREDAELAEFGRSAGFAPRTWIDPTGHIAWAELQRLDLAAAA
jgi:extracellular factor (EF) 3-hydroxypalmitic acid methyl ester biosynthesis protein